MKTFALGDGESRIRKWLDTELVAGYMFLAPYIIFVLVFLLHPMIKGLYISFHDWGVFGDPEFIGFANYTKLFADDKFWSSLQHTLYFVLLSTVPLVCLSLLFALALDMPMRWRNGLRGMFFFPYLLPVSVVATLWRWILQKEYGLLNYYLHRIGIDAPYWLGDARWAMPSIAITTVWWTIGFNIVIFLAALQDIPQQLQEAARIDGANGAKVFWYITLPLLRPTLLFVVIMQVIASFQIFGQVYVMTGGGPHGSTRTIVQYLYEQGFRYFKMGYASAIAYILFAIMMFFTLVQWKVMESD